MPEHTSFIEIPGGTDNFTYFLNFSPYIFLLYLIIHALESDPAKKPGLLFWFVILNSLSHSHICHGAEVFKIACCSVGAYFIDRNAGLQI